MRAMEEYDWPGNVRQLQHMIERLAILAPQNRIDDEAVLDAIPSMSSRDVQGGESLADTATDQIRKVLAATGGIRAGRRRYWGLRGRRCIGSWRGWGWGEVERHFCCYDS